MLTLPTPRALALAALLATQPAGASATEPPRLLGPTIASPHVAAAVADAATVRERAVRPDLATLDALARDHVATQRRSRLVLDLFPGLDLDAEVVHAEVRPSGTTIFARLTDVALGHAVLTHERGVLVGTIDFPGGTYAIEPAGDGSNRVVQRAPHLMPPELPPRARFGSSPAGAVEEAFEADVPADSGRLIDVMIVWSTDVQNIAGAAAAMPAQAQASIDNANLTYFNSGIAQRLRLVHSQAVTYTERTTCPGGGTKFDCALDDITDGVIPGVHALRDLHGADLVSIFIKDGAYCGIAWLPFPSAGSAGYGYSVLEWNGCPVSNKSFVHEVGHNMGAHHDPFVAPGPGAFAYSHGIVDLVDRWRDVMAYNNQCSANGFNCNRLQYMSNPKLAVNGRPLGDATTRNNSHTLNKTAKAIAAYRPTSPLHPVAPRFTDVPASHPFYGHVEFLTQSGLSTGCTTDLFCPDQPVTRRQMAVFLERAMKASNWVPPAATGLFTDVPSGAQFRDHVEALRNDGVTNGCTATTYCPDDPVTRAQMAAFLLRSSCGASYLPNPPASPSFQDVPATHPFYRFVERLYARGITGGCATGPLRYCPDAPVTRAQLAAFLERTYPLSAPTEACAP